MLFLFLKFLRCPLYLSLLACFCVQFCLSASSWLFISFDCSGTVIVYILFVLFLFYNDHRDRIHKSISKVVITCFGCRKGDYFRYMAEFKTSNEKKEAADQSLKAYQVRLCSQMPDFLRKDTSVRLVEFFVTFFLLHFSACFVTGGLKYRRNRSSSNSSYPAGASLEFFSFLL